MAGTGRRDAADPRHVAPLRHAALRHSPVDGVGRRRRPRRSGRRARRHLCCRIDPRTGIRTPGVAEGRRGPGPRGARSGGPRPRCPRRPAGRVCNPAGAPQSPAGVAARRPPGRCHPARGTPTRRRPARHRSRVPQRRSGPRPHQPRRRAGARRRGAAPESCDAGAAPRHGNGPPAVRHDPAGRAGTRRAPPGQRPPRDRAASSSSIGDRRRGHPPHPRPRAATSSGAGRLPRPARVRAPAPGSHQRPRRHD